MNYRNFIITVFVAFISLTASASPLLPDYSHIRGFCYPGGWRADKATIEKELGYAVRINLNSARIWLSVRQYQREPEAFIDQLTMFVRTAHSMGISTVPVFFNGNGLDTNILKPEFRKEGDEYVAAVINALKDEPGMLMWDIMNEPLCNDYYREAPESEQGKRLKEIYDFVRFYIQKTRELDSTRNPITVGVWRAQYLTETAHLVDVLSFHDYRETRAAVQSNYDIAKEVSANNGNKPIINNEMACTGRANPYDMAIELAEKNGAGWYVFELMIRGYWGDIHGIFYPDGTIRDPSILAAVLGFYRKRDLTTDIMHNPNKEGHAQKALAKIEEVLTDNYKTFESRRTSTDDILEAAEYAANLLEGAEMVPMIEPPTAKIETWRAMPEAERNAEEIRNFTYELAMLIRKWCRIL